MKNAVYFTFYFLLFSVSLFAQKKTQFITVERTMKAPASAVWKVVGEEFGDIHKSHPLVVSSSYTNNQHQGCEGAERVCNLNTDGSKYVKETQVNYDPENYSFKVQITTTQGIPLVPEYSYATYKVVPLDENTSKLVFEFNYRTKPAFMGGLAKGKFKKQLSNYMLAVEHYVTTGEEVNADNFDAIKKQYETR
ncbi:SRPBCC family protein [Flammeovirga sp. SJP92]|uniref:SRPBCC family protein n=1 Tax=Flammeovirga sp. SJP92 TaxID=1775430 RepID=UPI000787C470|nr:SRPBCC family protein [Flammeovirga sp. SJP92]KXX71567.1 hypothetical protein AVL50_04655 [Flammeovirga sp. SJP92]